MKGSHICWYVLCLGLLIWFVLLRNQCLQEQILYFSQYINICIWFFRRKKNDFGIFKRNLFLILFWSMRSWSFGSCFDSRSKKKCIFVIERNFEVHIFYTGNNYLVRNMSRLFSLSTFYCPVCVLLKKMLNHQILWGYFK